MFRFLVRNKNLQVVEVALAVIAPGPAEELLQVWMTTLLLSHGRLCVEIILKGNKDGLMQDSYKMVKKG